MSIDEWFKHIREKYADQMQCGKGCTACCYGLFDISLKDAAGVARGFRELPPDVQERVLSKATDIHREVVAPMADAAVPTLFGENDPRIDQIVEAANSPACPFLGDAGECLVYEHRPLSCRLEGVPMVDVRDGLFGDWCELNFTAGIPKEAMADLQLDYDAINEAGENTGDVTFIASVVAQYREFWGPAFQDFRTVRSD
jgi:Fe-S-cluster containining protein